MSSATPAASSPMGMISGRLAGSAGISRAPTRNIRNPVKISKIRFLFSSSILSPTCLVTCMVFTDDWTVTTVGDDRSAIAWCDPSYNYSRAMSLNKNSEPDVSSDCGRITLMNSQGC